MCVHNFSRYQTVVLTHTHTHTHTHTQSLNKLSIYIPYMNDQGRFPYKAI